MKTTYPTNPIYSYDEWVKYISKQLNKYRNEN